jgi:hypothetical protein
MRLRESPCEIDKPLTYLALMCNWHNSLALDRLQQSQESLDICSWVGSLLWTITEWIFQKPFLELSGRNLDG